VPDLPPKNRQTVVHGACGEKGEASVGIVSKDNSRYGIEADLNCQRYPAGHIGEMTFVALGADHSPEGLTAAMLSQLGRTLGGICLNCPFVK